MNRPRKWYNRMNWRRHVQAAATFGVVCATLGFIAGVFALFVLIANQSYGPVVLLGGLVVVAVAVLYWCCWWIAE